MELLFVITLMLVAAIVSGWMFWNGRERRFLNDHPICQSCEYDLRALPPQSLSCPECGADLASENAMRQGMVKPSVWWNFGGMIFLLLAFPGIPVVVIWLMSE